MYLGLALYLILFTLYYFMHDVIIIGSGIGGMTAGIQSAASKLKTLVLGREANFKSKCSLDIIDGELIVKKFKKLLAIEKDLLEFKKGEAYILEKNVVSFSVETKKGEVFYSRCVIVASGKTGPIFDILKYKEGEGIIVDSTMATNIPGVFAVGSANNSGQKSVLVTAGEGAKAAFSCAEFITENRRVG
jgi:thioredoxin reductase